jgi:peptidyl-prolyl cis-trans isomerase D
LAAAGQSHKVPVAVTDFFTAQGPKEKEIGQPQKFASVAFGLEKMAISQIQDLGNGYYILQMTDRVESTVPPFEEAAQKVHADVIKFRQDQQAKADAEIFKQKVEKGETFTATAADFKIDPLETGLFGRTGSIPQIGYEPQIQQQAFQLTLDKPMFPEVIQGRQGWYVLRLKGRQSPENEGFTKEKSDIVKRMTEQKKQTTFQSWLEDLRSRGKIEINKELIKS